MIGDNIRKYRKANNLSQDELAEKLDVTRQSVSLWENGQTQPSLDNIVALAKIFGIATDDLLVVDSHNIPMANIERMKPEEQSEEKSVKSTKTTRKKGIIFICIAIATVLLIGGGITAFLLSRDDRGGAKEPEPALSETEKTVEPTGKEEKKTEPSLPSTDEPETTEAQTEFPFPKTVVPVTAPPSTTASTQNQPPQTTAVTTKAVTTAPKETDPPESKKTEPASPPDIYGYLKDWVVENGTLNGDHCTFLRDSDLYGGRSGNTFSVYYWGDTDTVEITIHCIMSDTMSVNFTLIYPKENNGIFEYICSYFYRNTGTPYCQARGSIDGATFTENYPLSCSNYIGSKADQNDFMEWCRQGICEALDCMKNLIKSEKLKYSLADMGFKKY